MANQPKGLLADLEDWSERRRQERRREQHRGEQEQTVPSKTQNRLMVRHMQVLEPNPSKPGNLRPGVEFWTSQNRGRSANQDPNFRLNCLMHDPANASANSEKCGNEAPM